MKMESNKNLEENIVSNIEVNGEEKNKAVNQIKVAQGTENPKSLPEVPSIQNEAEKEPKEGLWSKLVKKQILTTQELEQKLLEGQHEKISKLKPKALQGEVQKPEVKQTAAINKPKEDLKHKDYVYQKTTGLKGAEKFNHHKYANQITAPKTIQKSAKKTKDYKGNRSKLRRFGLTTAVLLIVIAAYAGIEQVVTIQQENALFTVTDTVPENGQPVSSQSQQTTEPTPNKVEVLEEQDIDAKINGATATSQDDNASAGGASINNDSDYFINYRLEREKIRGQQLELLEEMINTEGTLPEVKKEAQEKILSITKAIEEELLLESLLTAKYGSEAVVFVQPTKVNVVLRQAAAKMSDNEAEKIAQLVHTYTGLGYENAIIVIKE